VVTAQLKAKAVRVKTGTIIDATIIASASEGDDDARWVKHKGKPAVHGFKAHVGADADTALVEEVAVTPANVNDGRAGPDALPDAPGEVFADSAYRGAHFREAVRAKGGTPHIAVTGMWGIGRTTDAGEAGGLQRAHPPGAQPHRENLRYLETKLRPAAHAMDRHRQGRRPGSPHRYRLQPQAHSDHHRQARLIDQLQHLGAAEHNTIKLSMRAGYPSLIRWEIATRAQVSRKHDARD
jgi:hypothetical protein